MLSTKSQLAISTPKLAQEERLRNFTSGTTAYYGMTRGEALRVHHETIHGNSPFQKHLSLRWTWELPGGGYRNDINHNIVNKRFCLTDVAVVPKFYAGSDHRLLRGRREEKAAKFRERHPRTIINRDLFTTLAGFWEDSGMDNIDEE